MENIKITIVVQGGVVIGLYSDSENINYRIVDLDIKEGEIPEFNEPDFVLPAQQHIQHIYE